MFQKKNPTVPVVALHLHWCVLPAERLNLLGTHVQQRAQAHEGAHVKELYDACLANQETKDSVR